jgi:hypothetical protein
MKNLDAISESSYRAAQHELLQVFDEVFHSLGIQPINDIFELSYNQWLKLSDLCYRKNFRNHANLAKNIGLDLRSGYLKKPLIYKD